MKYKRIAILFTPIVFLLTQLLDTSGFTNQAYAASSPQQGETVRFVVTGDSRGVDSDPGVNTTILAEIAQATVDEGVDFILFTGDLVYGNASTQSDLEAQLTTWRNTMQPVYDEDIGVYPIRGNHEINSNAAWTKVAWDNVFSGDYALPGNGPSGEENITFSFAHSNIFVVGFDQYTPSYHRFNQAWLDAQFASNTQPHVFVFGHAPAFKVRHWDCLDDYPSERDIFWNSIEAEGGRTYFAGHDHFYDHARLDDGDGDPDDDLHQFIAGTAGAGLASDGAYNGTNSSWTPQRILHEQEYGYVLVEIDGLNATLTWKHRAAPGVYQTAGDVFTYTVILEPPVPPAAPTGLTATAISASRIDLDWTDNADNEANFEIERSTDGSGGPFSLLDTVSANTTTYQDTGLSAETGYCYRVRAVNAAGPSAFTDVACTTTEIYVTYLALVCR